ncbi:MAG: DUF3429 domain-containing protein [Gammaproteobacteria bacterium]|nr:DUF3429 domain-containing protein [Gammaproteobacteria bacterium]
MTTQRLYKPLALAGTLPFLACAILPLAGIPSVPMLGALDAVASSYGLAIICFLAGAQWGLYLSGQVDDSFNLFVISNAVLLAVWFAFIGASLEWAITTQIVAFLMLLFIDYRLKVSEVVSDHYFSTRSVVTLVVIVSLLMILRFQ